MQESFNQIKNELQALQTSFNYLSSEYDDLKKESHDQKQIINELKNENLALNKRVLDISSKLISMEQLSRSCNVEFQGVPEKKQENPVEIVKKICEVTSGQPLPDESIISCRRVAKLNPASTRPRSILVTLPSPRHRDSVLSSVYRFNRNNSTEKLNSHSIGLSGEKSQIYAVEHLPLEVRALQAEARRLAKEKQYKFVWVRFGKIYVRKNETSKPFLIKNEDSLKLIV